MAAIQRADTPTSCSLFRVIGYTLRNASTSLTVKKKVSGIRRYFWTTSWSQQRRMPRMCSLRSGCMAKQLCPSVGGRLLDRTQASIYARYCSSPLGGTRLGFGAVRTGRLGVLFSSQRWFDCCSCPCSLIFILNNNEFYNEQFEHKSLRVSLSPQLPSRTPPTSLTPNITPNDPSPNPEALPLSQDKIGQAIRGLGSRKGVRQRSSYNRQCRVFRERNRTEQARRAANSSSLSQITKPAPSSPRSYRLRYDWLARPSDYPLLSVPDIEEQHSYLLGEVVLLQQELKKGPEASSRVSSKPLRRSNQVSLSQNRDRQIENNLVLIARLRNEAELLQRQASPMSKETIDCKILQVRQKISRTKQKIKQVKHRSKAMGDSLDNGHDYFEEMKRLEHQRDGLLVRKAKIQEKITHNIHAMQKLIEKLADIEGKVLFADSFLEEWHQTRKQEVAERGVETEFQQKQYQVELLKKTLESTKNTKQQKYHQLLKNLEAEIEKEQFLEQKAQKAEIKNLYQKKELLELEEALSQIDLANSRSRTSGSVEPFKQRKETEEEHKLDLPLPSQLPAVHKFYKISTAKRNLSSSRTKTSGQAPNLTEILAKPPSSESDMSMLSQPARGYLRAHRNRLSSQRNVLTALGEKSIDFNSHIRQQIIEQSPEKETIEKDPVEVKVRLSRVQKEEGEEGKQHKSDDDRSKDGEPDIRKSQEHKLTIEAGPTEPQQQVDLPENPDIELQIEEQSKQRPQSEISKREDHEKFLTMQAATDKTLREEENKELDPESLRKEGKEIQEGSPVEVQAKAEEPQIPRQQQKQAEEKDESPLKSRKKVIEAYLSRFDESEADQQEP